MKTLFEKVLTEWRSTALKHSKRARKLRNSAITLKVAGWDDALVAGYLKDALIHENNAKALWAKVKEAKARGHLPPRAGE